MHDTAHKHSAEPPAGNSHAADLHDHVHEHDGVRHVHAHHHRTGLPAHTHGHTLAFEGYSALCSPIHDLDPRAKIISMLVLVLAAVLTAPMRIIEFSLLVAFLFTLTVISGVPIRAILARSALVLPVAGAIALFAPLANHTGSWNVGALGTTYSSGWIVAWGILSKAWISAFSALLLAATTPPPRLFQGLRALKMPEILVTMLVFLYRYSSVLGDQLRSLRLALASRGFSTRGRRLIALYGNLAGNLFIRAYERGERVYAAMLARGFSGTLPVSEPLRFQAADLLALTVVALSASALALY